QAGRRARELDAAPGKLDRRREQLAPRQPAEGPVCRLEAGDRTGNGAGRRPDPERLRRRLAEADVDDLHLAVARRALPETRRSDEEVGQARDAAGGTMDEHEAA